MKTLYILRDQGISFALRAFVLEMVKNNEILIINVYIRIYFILYHLQYYFYTEWVFITFHFIGYVILWVLHFI